MDKKLILDITNAIEQYEAKTGHPVVAIRIKHVYSYKAVELEIDVDVNENPVRDLKQVLDFDGWKRMVSKARDEVVSTIKAFPAVVARIDEVQAGTFTEDEAMAHLIACNAIMLREIDAL